MTEVKCYDEMQYSVFHEEKKKKRKEKLRVAA